MNWTPITAVEDAQGRVVVTVATTGLSAVAGTRTLALRTRGENRDAEALPDAGEAPRHTARSVAHKRHLGATARPERTAVTRPVLPELRLFGDEQRVRGERNDGSPEAFSQCLIRDVELGSEVLTGGVAGDRVVALLDG